MPEYRIVSKVEIPPENPSMSTIRAVKPRPGFRTDIPKFGVRSRGNDQRSFLKRFAGPGAKKG